MIRAFSGSWSVDSASMSMSSMNAGTPENVTAAVGYYRGVLTSLLGVPGAGPDPYQEATDSLGEVC